MNGHGFGLKRPTSGCPPSGRPVSDLPLSDQPFEDRVLSEPINWTKEREFFKQRQVGLIDKKIDWN